MEGIDVSSYQGTIDWTKVKTDFVYIKLSQGVRSHDPRVNEYANGAHQAGIKFGYYHFSTVNSTDVIADASAEVIDVIAHLKTLPSPTLAFVLDIETNEIELTQEQIQLWINTFITGMEHHGYKVILYSGLSWLNTNLPQNHNLGNVPLWLAEYTKAANPILPRGWKDYTIWQYSSEGHVMGIQGKVDLNHAKVLI